MEGRAACLVELSRAPERPPPSIPFDASRRVRWLGPPLPELSRGRAVNGSIGWSRIPSARLWDNRGGVVAIVLSLPHTVFMAECRPVAPVDINYNGKR